VTGTASNRPGETAEQRADRRYAELLQELRVAQTGVQFLFAFLLTLAFTQRFTEITEFQKWLYIATLMITALASALLIGPVSFHRILFHRGLKPRLVTGADLMTRGGLAMLLVAINAAVLLILDVVVGGTTAWLLAGASTAWFVLIWYVLPYSARENRD
jgi:hypothetical protein